jgi:hypothetical protein
MDNSLLLFVTTTTIASGSNIVTHAFPISTAPTFAKVITIATTKTTGTIPTTTTTIDLI